MTSQTRFIDIPKSLTDVVEEKIRQMIMSGELQFGQQITETRLSEMFNLSKTPIREALLRLSAGERLVEIKPRTGTFIFSLTEKEVANISSFRIMLEQEAIRSSMQSTSHAVVLAELGKNLNASESLLEKENLPRYRQLDSNFHGVFLRHAENPYLIDAYKVISTKVWAMRNRLSFSPDYVRQSIEEHAGIVHTLMAGELDKACKLVADHINNGFTAQSLRLLTTME